MKSKRGGKRTGSGRKSGQPTVTTGFRVNEAALKKCKSIYGRKLNAKINEHVINLAGEWVKVVHASDCIYQDWDDARECPTCPQCWEDYAECECPGPHQNDEYEYQEFNGVLYAKKISR